MSETLLGFHCSHEQHPPSALLRHVQRAADAGFTAAMCSDHFHPWSSRQGHAGFAWSWLGSALARTSLSFGTVCAPGQRYHPAIIAQAAATLAEMYPERFWLAIGSGEALNESITGADWPAKDDRRARLRECADTMRALWAGETVTRKGQVETVAAQLYSRPEQPPLLVGAALTPETARWMGGWADAMVTVAGPRDKMQEVVDAFRDGGGAGKPMFLQVTLSYAPSDREAEAAAFDQWRQAALSPQQLGDLASPQEFDRACESVLPGDLFTKVRVSSDIERHLAWLHEDCTFGFNRIYLHNVARVYQEQFIEACGERLLPAFAPPMATSVA